MAPFLGRVLRNPSRPDAAAAENSYRFWERSFRDRLSQHSGGSSESVKSAAQSSKHQTGSSWSQKTVLKVQGGTLVQLVESSALDD